VRAAARGSESREMLYLGTREAFLALEANPEGSAQPVEGSGQQWGPRRARPNPPWPAWLAKGAKRVLLRVNIEMV
jgi:hypothetical protein